MATTPTKLNEYNQAEEPARRLLERLGWRYLHPDGLRGDRGDYRGVLLQGRLRDALLRLNEWMTQEQAERVIHNLEHVDAVGMARNQRIHEYLTYGMPLTVQTGRRQETRIVRFFDFERPESGLNDFAVTTQFYVRRSGERGEPTDDERAVIPDLVLFVNGVPLVVMEAKSPTLGGEWKSRAVRQLCRYQEAAPEWHGVGAPALFHYNLLCVAHCGAAASYAAYGAPESAYFEWKSTLPYTDDDIRSLGFEPEWQAQLIAGLLSPSTLLDVLRDYVVYEPERGRIVKKLPRYQQYRAVRASLERILSGRKPEERGGVVWHTQGSGKSLTMLWLAVKVRREPRLANATILVVTDRTQLDRQIAETFERCGFPAPEQASSTRALRRLLTAGPGRTIMTTVQKFEEALTSPEGELDMLNPSENVVVMVDEAHRTQYGVLGARMSKALPNAALIGFTGTPVDRGFRRSTMQRFGPLIDSYTIPQSVADGATVPIYYEPRLPQLSIEGPETLDQICDALFSDVPEEMREQIRRRYANKEVVAEAERRIEMIALDIATHFKEHVRPNGFKAQVVAPSRAAVLRYAEHLNNFGVRAYPIITADRNDGPEFNDARALDQAQVTNAFVDSQGEPEALVVVDMLLTGFDAPVEQTLYLDRALREHGLLQAIARVNRRFSHEWDGVATEKSHGLVVDYRGVSRELDEALASFDPADVREAMRALEDEPEQVIEAAARQAESHFTGRDIGDTLTCVAVFAPDASTEGDYKADLFERFNADYRGFSHLMDRFLPDPRALAYVDRLARLTEIRACVRAQFLRENAAAEWTAIGAKVKRLIDQRISAEVRELMTPVSVLDSDFDEKIAALPHDEAKASLMEHAIRAQINERFSANPAYYEHLSAQLSRIIQELRDRLIDAAEASRRMKELRREATQEDEVAAEHGLSPLGFAIYGTIEGTPETSSADGSLHEERTSLRASLNEEVRDAALAVEDILRGYVGVVDWQSNLEVQREIRRDIKGALRKTSQYAEEQLDALANRIVDMALRSADL